MAGTMTGCRPAASEAAHGHDENLQLTSYNEDFEVYAEVTPPSPSMPMLTKPSMQPPGQKRRAAAAWCSPRK